VERTEVAEIEALRSMFSLVPGDLAEELGVAILELGEAVAVRASFLSGAPEVNHALGVSTSEQLDALAGFYGGTRHAVSPLPGVDIDAELRARGYEPGYAWMKFSRGVDPPTDVATDLRILEVGEKGGADFGRAAVEGFGLPARAADWLERLPGHGGWHCFVAYDGSEPAAAGAVHVFEDIAWCGIAGTRQEFRRRGAQSAILAARIRRAAELGCTLVVTETGELVDDRPSNSYRNILRAGFEPQYLRANYVPKTTEPARASQVNVTGSIRPARTSGSSSACRRASSGDTV
jgi:GNAT superfamily N-acetyltransferase